jgi:ribosomal protein S4
MSDRSFQNYFERAYTDIVMRGQFVMPTSEVEAESRIQLLKIKIDEAQSKLNTKAERDFPSPFEYHEWKRRAGNVVFFGNLERKFLKKYLEAERLKTHFGDTIFDFLGSSNISSQ